jgi:hypothetical protein
MTVLEATARDAEEAITAHRDALSTRNECADKVVEISRERAELKLAAVTALMQQDFPATPGKKFTYTQACDTLQIDPAYADHKRRLEEAEAALREADAEVEHWAFTAELRIAQFKAEAGVK